MNREYELENVVMMIKEFTKCKNIHLQSMRECAYLSRAVRAPNSPSLGADDIQPHPAPEDPSEVDSTRWPAGREKRR